jgi:hypothetical protein
MLDKKEITVSDLNGGFKIVNPAEAILTSVMVATDILNSKREMNDKRMKEYRLGLMALNSYLKSHQIKQGYLRLEFVPEKIAAIKAAGRSRGRR